MVLCVCVCVCVCDELLLPMRTLIESTPSVSGPVSHTQGKSWGRWAGSLLALKARSCNFTDSPKLSQRQPHTLLGRPTWFYGGR